MAKSASLRQVEQQIQELWEKTTIFDGIETEDESYMATFPFPYMNGLLHLGHGLTLLKAEFAVQNERHKGKQGLFPFSFHATGMPIVACADKLKRELEDSKEISEETSTEVTQETANTEYSEIKTKYHSAKSKLSSKSGKTQKDTMMLMGIPEEEISKFTNPHYWLEYFIPLCIQDLKGIGAGIDWTRTFTTSDINPYFDKFVRWQFNKLHESKKLKFGNRYTIWSPKDNQPCQDHDRSSGEGVKPQEYTLVNFETLPNEQQTKLRQLIKEQMTHTDTTYIDCVDMHAINLLTATLRPETMFGLTNLWVHPELEYGVYFHEFNGKPQDIIVVLPRSAENMRHQEHRLTHIATIKGEHLLGLHVSPVHNTSDSNLYVLPMLQISANKGTGIVSSVPTESPDDYLNLLVLQNTEHPHHKTMFEKYHQLTLEMVMNQPIPIINIPNSEYVNQPAIVFCQNNNIKNPKALQGQKLQEAKKEIYTLSKAKGVFIVPEYNNQKVEDVIPVLMKQKLETQQWFKYAEPESEVISRSGDKCVVSLTDQWFIDYGEPSWKKELEEHLDGMDMYSDKGKEQFQIAKDWLYQWPCSRTYGLGTKLDIPTEIPIDPNTIIDSLSDSTIYMALYTIYHQLKTIPIEAIDDTLFDFIFLKKELPEDHKHDTILLTEMRNSFDYWYPMDLRVSGKDLVQNHLTFCLYSHLAIWGNDKTKLPKSFRTNGHVTIDGEKMSKSKGNFITINYIRKNYSADAMRLAVACASSNPIEDTDYKSNAKTEDGLPDLDILNNSILKLHTQLEWMKQLIPKVRNHEYRDEMPHFFDLVFQNQIKSVIKSTQKHMDELTFYEAVQESFYRLIIMRDQYEKFVDGDFHLSTIRFFIEAFLILNTPFIPHLTEYCWQMYNDNTNLTSVITRQNSVRFQKYPTITDIDDLVLEQYKYIRTVIETVGVIQKRWCKQNNKSVKDIQLIEVKVGTKQEEWKLYVIELIKSYMEMNNKTLKDINMKHISPILSSDEGLKQFKINYKKKVAPFVAKLVKRGNEDDLNTEEKFDKISLLKNTQTFLQTYLENTIVFMGKDGIEPNKPEITFQ